MGPQGHGAGGLFENVPQVELDRIEFHLAGLDLGEVEDVVDHGEQRIRRGAGGLDVVALLRGELGVQSQFRHSQDAVHGRPDLMAHVGQELALGQVGRGRGQFGGLANLDLLAQCGGPLLDQIRELPLAAV